MGIIPLIDLGERLASQLRPAVGAPRRTRHHLDLAQPRDPIVSPHHAIAMPDLARSKPTPHEQPSKAASSFP
eukprot:2719416-Rhodomonas_salina.11